MNRRIIRFLHRVLSIPIAAVAAVATAFGTAVAINGQTWLGKGLPVLIVIASAFIGGIGCLWLIGPRNESTGETKTD